MNNSVSGSEDFHNLYVGRTVTLKTFPARLFMVMDDRDIFKEQVLGVDNPVTIVTIDDSGRPHTLVASAYCLTYG